MQGENLYNTHGVLVLLCVHYGKSFRYGVAIEACERAISLNPLQRTQVGTFGIFHFTFPVFSVHTCRVATTLSHDSSDV
jgi:hypothetical protein